MPIRAPPVRFLDPKIQKPKQEDKTVKYTPKKVFILEDGKYIEMPYEEFNRKSRKMKVIAKNGFFPCTECLWR